MKRLTYNKGWGPDHSGGGSSCAGGCLSMQEKEEREEKVMIQNCVLIYNSSFLTNLGKY